MFWHVLVEVTCYSFHSHLAQGGRVKLAGTNFRVVYLVDPSTPGRCNAENTFHNIS